MSETVAVIIPTFGDRAFWNPLAARAVASASNQTHPVDEIVRLHGASLWAARSTAIEYTESDWILCLDADDEIEPTYVEEMLAGVGDVRWPRVRVVMDTPDEKIQLPDPIEIQPREPNLFSGNHIVVGAFIRRSIFDEVGGFRDLEVCEDWDLWLRCWIAGAQLEPCLSAVYRQHWRAGSRNQMESHRYKTICDGIREGYYPEAHKKGLV